MTPTTFQHRGKDDNPPREPRDQNKDLNPTKEPMDKAKEIGTQVADKAREIGSEVMDKTKEAISSVGETASNLGKKADEITATAGTNVKHLGEKIEEQGPHGGVLGQASHVVADTLRTSGKYIEEAKLSGMADDVTGLIRRNPVPAVLIGISLGFLLGRAMRA